MLISYLQKINEKPQVINDYEAGRAIPNQAVLGKMERALGKKILFFYTLCSIRPLFTTASFSSLSVVVY